MRQYKFLFDSCAHDKTEAKSRQVFLNAFYAESLHVAGNGSGWQNLVKINHF